MRILVAVALFCSVVAVFSLPQHKKGGGGGKPPGGGSGHPHGHTRQPSLKASQPEIPAKDQNNLRDSSMDPDVPVVPTLDGFTDSADLPEAQGYSTDLPRV
ncbi:hypothetical protein ANCCAN_16420 [Ancylostoma caninum]|uniref:Uncharacterized protein n=1 Tax=Ancylostoma caninum TaxID=29170 RepID=A0A368G3S7_ANCCA|nr:hypothetical protein ANCCAN_16420 [Ancylostoma caninum]